MGVKRTRRVYSIKAELIRKSREAALSAVQVFNNPLVQFKSETYIVLMIIAWTYLLHAYYKQNGIEYRYYKKNGSRRTFDRTKTGAYKYWELERCLNDDKCPLDKATANNLRFLIKLRHEIEHQMSLSLDNYLSGRYQACALNYCHYIKELFGTENGMDHHLTYSIQFVALSHEQIMGEKIADSLPDRMKAFIAEFDNALTDDEISNERFSYRLLFLRKTVNRRGQADSVVEFIDPKSDLAKEIEKLHLAVKEVERPKLRPTTVCETIQDEGFPKFNVYYHTRLWKNLDGKNPAKGYGTKVEGTWYWYESWVEIVRQHCKESGEKYK